MARAGDGDARGACLDTFRTYLKLLARAQLSRRLQGKADPSDIVQQTFLDAHRNFGKFRGSTEAELAAWLRCILAGNLANHLRHYVGTKQRDARLEDALAVELNDASGLLERGLAVACSSPSRQAVRREVCVLLANALEDLPEDYRTVIVLRHLDGLPFAEVASRMGRSLASVQNLWVRALARLRKGMGETAP